MRLSNSSKEKTRDKNKRRNEGKAKGVRGTGSATQALLHKMGHPMKWDQIEKNWDEYLPRVKGHWDKISDHNLILINGDREELRRHVQQEYSLSRHEADAQLDEFLIQLNT